MNEAPTLYMAGYRAEEVLGSRRVLPVWVGYEDPIIPLSYRWVRGPRSLRPESWILFEWDWLCAWYRQKLDEAGAQRIARELRRLSEAAGGKPLALVDYDDLVRGDRSHRIIFSAWWEERTGQAVPELTDEGPLHYGDLHPRVQPTRQKDPTQDRRYRQEDPLPWPLTHEDIARWIEGRYWQQARSRTNPHSYTIRAWGDETNFQKVVLHIRQFGYEAEFGGDTYVQLDVEDRFYWTMGDPLPTTVVLNRKPLPGEDERPEPEEGQPGLFSRGRAGR